MTRLKSMLVAGVVMAGTTASLLIHRRTRIELSENACLLQQHQIELATLVAEHERLSNQLALAKEPAPDPTAELGVLRNRVEALREQTNQLAQSPAELRPWTPSETSTSPDAGSSSVSAYIVSDSDSEEYRVQLWKLACASPHSFPLTNGWTMRDARNLSRAVRFYAREHQGEFPSAFDEAADYYQKDTPSPRTSDFELVFQGSTQDLANIPEQAVALLRERQTWPTPGGKSARIYVMAGGDVRVVESDDNFQSWEAEHVIPPPASAGATP